MRRVKYGFDPNAARDAYVINEEHMDKLERIFHMVGVEGMSHNAIKPAFEREGLPTPGGGKHWDHSFFRLCVFDDLYRPHAYEEVEAVVSPEVAARIDKTRHYGLWWFNRLRTKTKQVSESSEYGRVHRKETRRSVKFRDGGSPYRSRTPVYHVNSWTPHGSAARKTEHPLKPGGAFGNSQAG